MQLTLDLAALEPNFNIGEVKTTYQPNRSYNLPKIGTSKDAFEYLRRVWDKNSLYHVEHFMVVFLSNSKHVLGHALISIGTSNACIVDPKIIFQKALLVHAVSLVISHSHPSGNPQPSEADLTLTKKMVQAGKLLDMKVVDHLILLGEESYVSLADEGLM